MRRFSFCLEPRSTAALFALASLCVSACAVHPPASQPPTGQAAIDRLRATGACGTGVQASAKANQFGIHGRVRADVLFFAQAPSKLRMDIVSPFGGTLATLSSDATRFALADFRDKRFFTGRATACNIARLTTIPVPGNVLVDLLRGQAPLLKHDAASIAWSGRGYWIVDVPSTREAREELHLAPNPDDWNKPWSEMRVRLVDVKVEQAGVVLYHAELDDHRAASTAKPRVDPDGVEPPMPPSGPQCDAEIPRRIHVEVPSENADVLFRYDDVVWNPPIPPGTFVQSAPPGMEQVPVECE